MGLNALYGSHPVAKEHVVHLLIIRPITGSGCLHELDSHVPGVHAPESHTEQILSDLGVHGDASNVLERHCVHAMHMRSWFPEQFWASKFCPATQPGLHGAHAASAMALHETTYQDASAGYFAGQLSFWTEEQFTHTASCVALHGLAMYWPAGHCFVHGMHTRSVRWVQSVAMYVSGGHPPG